jgi:protoheme ferro-lyase
MYASAAKNFAGFTTREEKLKVIKELCDKIKQKIPSYQEFEANFKELYYTNNFTKQKSLVKYILAKIHENYTKDKVTNYDLMTIEHLLPQSKVAHNGHTEKEVGQLGNLILIPAELNQALGHKGFSDKRTVLESKNVFLDDAVKNAVSWDKKQIEGRTKWMANLAYHSIWKI